MNERELLSEALAHPGRAERAQYLDQACGGDARLRARLAFLLAMHESDHTPPDPPAPEQADEDSDSPTPAAALAPLLPLLESPHRSGSLGRLGQYEVLEALGQGGYGIVLRAHDEKLERVVALKVLSPVLALTPAARKRFLREARAAAQIRHDNVVQIYAVHEQPLPYLAMELIDGPTLQGKVDVGGPLEPAEVVRLGTQIALGLAAAHEKGLIHRDVKPANILLEHEGEPGASATGVCARLTDFGLARTTDDVGLTSSGTLLGTPAYMAPEQAKGEPLDHRADLFSLGSVLYFLCTGRPPFRAPNTLAVMKRVAEEAPRPIRELNPSVPEGLCAVIARLHRKNPTERFASAQEVVRALSHCLTDPGARPTPSRWKGAVAIVGVVLLLAGAGWLVREITRPAPGGTPVVPKGEPSENAVARRGAEDQIEAVVARLKQLNPKFNEKALTHRIEDGVVIALEVSDDSGLHDLTPLRDLTGLTDVQFRGQWAGVADIGPLRGMKLVRFYSNGCGIQDLSPLAGMPLTTAFLWGHAADDLSPLRDMKLVKANLGGPRLRDISVLKGMPLEWVCLNGSAVEDLSPLAGAPLRELMIANMKVKDLSPVARAPIELLHVYGTPIEDYSVLRNWPLKELFLDYDPKRHAKLLRDIPTLQTINGKPTDEVLGEPWEDSVARKDAEGQVKAVAARLKQLNPKFDETSVGHRVENGVVVGLVVGNCGGLDDLTPLRALAELKDLNLQGIGAGDIGPLRGLKLVSFESNGCPIKDLSPLVGMPLTAVLIWSHSSDDLSPLRGMKLVRANLGGGPVKDISVLKGMPLEWLCLNHTAVEDLSPLTGAPLKSLMAANCKVKDLSPIARAPIEILYLDGTPIEDYSPLRNLPLRVLEIDEPQRHAKLLRAIPTLTTINNKPAAEVLGGP